MFEITSPLHLAANDGDKSRLQELFATGEYDVDAEDERGRTPLVREMGKLLHKFIVLSINSFPDVRFLFRSY